ncbi:MAG: protein translocase subunit SecD [Candidatus Kaiserbacteria bacterium]|nr:protein translocase subunit SecD [Candidatus Kaiserbacteria bacterium]
MAQKRVIALVILVLGALIGWWVYHSEMIGSKPFKLGLDLSGGTQLVYRADTANIPAAQVADQMDGLRQLLQRRVNSRSLAGATGVLEPLVQVEKSGGLTGVSEERVIVELPGVTDTQKAIDVIGQTPLLEFRMLKQGVTTLPSDFSTTSVDTYFEPAAITGKDLASAQLQFQSGTGLSNEPVVVLKFDSEGTKTFADLTAKNVGRYFGIFIDGIPVSIPVIRESIPNGTAVISGSFTAQEAKDLASNLNNGALPVKIELLSTQTVSGTLGAKAVQDGLVAGLWGVGFVALFMILWYRLPGLLAAVALILYIVVNLALFKMIPVTLTAAGIAAFILSIGMAVDANVLIFERMKEELRSGKTAEEAIQEGFSRAWPSIRDSNISSMITAVILFWLGTSLIKGFALVFGLGVLVSMLTAITVSRTFLLALGIARKSTATRFFFGSGISH